MRVWRRAVKVPSSTIRSAPSVSMSRVSSAPCSGVTCMCAPCTFTVSAESAEDMRVLRRGGTEGSCCGGVPVRRPRTFPAAPQHLVLARVREQISVRPRVQVDGPLVYRAEGGIVAFPQLSCPLFLCLGVAARRSDASGALRGAQWKPS